MAGKKFKQRKTDVIQDGIVFRLYKGEYSIYTYTEALPETVILPDHIGDIPVTLLDSNCFYRSHIREAVLPDSIRRIGSAAFGGCKNLETISIPNNITHVHYDAFERCKNLKHTPYSHGQYLGNPENPYLILHRNGVIEQPAEGEQIVVEVHPETRFILSGAFNRFFAEAIPFADIDQLILHDKLVSIDGGAFSLSFSFGFHVKKIKLVCADSLETLCRAGSHIPSLAEKLVVGGQVIGHTLTIPEAITEIASMSFCNCDWLKTLRFEGDITTIGLEAFKGCKHLKEIHFPQKVGCIQLGAFAECPALEKVAFFEVGKIDIIAFELTHPAFPGQKIPPREDGLREIIFHNRIGKLCDRAFSNNMVLENVTGLENIESTEGNPFAGTPFGNRFA